MTVNTIRVGDVQLTRVGYADAGVDPARVGLTAEQIAAVPWALPLWAEGGQVRAGAAVWIIDTGDARIAVDPAQAADEILRTDADAAAHQEAFASILEAAGLSRESVTHAIATHVEGIGMWAWRNDDGSWSPFFPNAKILVSQRELDALDSGSYAGDNTGVWAKLRAQDAVRALHDGEHVTDDVSVEHVGAHTPGHLFVRIDSNGEHAVMVGHLAVSPLHFATGPCPQQHPFPDEAEAHLQKLREEDTWLIGPLWPTPGAGRWDGEKLNALAG